MSGDFNDDTNFPYNLLLTNTQLSRIRKAFAISSLANTKFSEPRLSKLMHSCGKEIIVA